MEVGSGANRFRKTAAGERHRRVVGKPDWLAVTTMPRPAFPGLWGLTLPARVARNVGRSEAEDGPGVAAKNRLSRNQAVESDCSARKERQGREGQKLFG